MRLFVSVCGCADPISDSITSSRPSPRPRCKDPASHIALNKPVVEMGRVRWEKNALASGQGEASLQQKYDELEHVLNKCKEELSNLSNSSAATPSHLRHQYVALGADLRKCKELLQGFQEEAKPFEADNLLKMKYRALGSTLYKYRKDIEDELQKCWTRLKLQHLESQFASAYYGKN